MSEVCASVGRGLGRRSVTGYIQVGMAGGKQDIV